MRSDSATGNSSCAVALPWLGDALDELRRTDRTATLPQALGWFLARSQTCTPGEESWRSWLIRHVSGGDRLLGLHRAGPLRWMSLGVGAETKPGDPPPEATTWACAEPVHLAAGLDHLRLERLQGSPLTQTDSDALVASLNSALADRGWTIVAGAGSRWVLACSDVVRCDAPATTEAAGRVVSDLLPDGPDGRRVRALINEMQMILHDHPVNERRAASGEMTVNAIWVWGFGAMRQVEHLALPLLVTDDDWLRDLWIVHRGPLAADCPGALRAARAEPQVMLVSYSVAPAAAAEDRLAFADEAVLAPLRIAHAEGRVESIELHTGSVVSHVARRDRWSLWRRLRPSRR